MELVRLAISQIRELGVSRIRKETPMILETLSASIAGVAALGLPERIAAAIAFLVYVSAVAGLRRLEQPLPTARSDREHEDLRDAA